jgi:hypothetical protein
MDFAMTFKRMLRILARVAVPPLLGVPASLAVSGCEPEVLTLTVTNPTDGAPGSLRDAVNRANAVTVGSHESILIQLDVPARLNLCGTGTDDQNASGDIDLRIALPVELRGKDGTEISQICGGERVLQQHSSARLTLTDVTVANGRLTDPANPRGGGVLAAGDVTLQRATIRNNTIRVVADGVALHAQGAGLFARSLSATASVLSTNEVQLNLGTAAGGGAYVVGAVAIDSSTLSSNRAVSYSGEARGGGLAQELASPMRMSGSTLASNSAHAGTHDRMFGTNTPVRPGTAVGGGLAVAGPLVLDGIAASHNQVHAHGPTAAARGGAVAAEGSSVIANSQFLQSVAGAGVSDHWRLETAADGSQCWANTEAIGLAPGSAIWVAANLELSATVLGGSITTQGTGSGCLPFEPACGMYPACPPQPPPDAPKSAIFTSGSMRGDKVTIADSTGFAIRALGAIELVNTTLSRNGGIVLTPSLTLVHSTVFDSAASLPPMELSVRASVLTSIPASDPSSPLHLMGPLADNGGPVPTHLPGPSLVDSVPCSGVTEDARRVSRPQGPSCDIGAVEVEATP